MTWEPVLFLYLFLLVLNGLFSPTQKKEEDKTPEKELAEAFEKYLSVTKKNPQDK